MITGHTLVSGESHKRGLPTGTAWSRLGGIGTVGTAEAAGAGVATVDVVGCGRGARGGVLARREASQGASPGPKTLSTAGGTVPAAAAVHLRAYEWACGPNIRSVKSRRGGCSRISDLDGVGSLYSVRS